MLAYCQIIVQMWDFQAEMWDNVVYFCQHHTALGRGHVDHVLG
jgi:hypothetical protein